MSKLYTEEQVKDLKYWKNNAEEDYLTTPISVLKYISELEKLTPIELPSDEEIGKEDIINLWNWLNDGYVIRRSLPTIEELIGWFEAKWMKEQILNQNK